MHPKDLSFGERTWPTESRTSGKGQADFEVNLAVLQLLPQDQGDGITSLKNSGTTCWLRFIRTDNTPDTHISYYLRRSIAWCLSWTTSSQPDDLHLSTLGFLIYKKR